MTNIEKARQIVANDPRNAPFEQWCRSVLDGEHDGHHEVLRALNARSRMTNRERAIWCTVNILIGLATVVIVMIWSK